MPKQILLVEDSVTMQKVVQIAFAKEDYQIIAVSSADEALARLREARPDAMVIDAGLTGKNGYDLATAARGEANGKDVPVLLLTSNFNPYDEARGQRSGVNANLVKPFDTQSVIDKVSALIKGGVTATVAAQAATPPVAKPQAPVQPVVQPAPPAVQAAPPVQQLGNASLRPPAPAPAPAAKPKESAAAPVVMAPVTPPAQTVRPEPSASEGARMPEPTRAASSSAQGAGIPSQVPQMPRPSLIPRAAVPAPVLAALEKIAARGAEYEAVARLSAETIAQIAWEVVPELAEIILRGEADKAKERRT
jgi:DNA-binding response OmpR family regulator